MSKSKQYSIALVFGLLLTGLIYLSINNEPEYPNSAYATQQRLTSVATYPAFYTAEYGGATLTPAPMEKARMIATNQAKLAPTCPGIADLAGNCMEQFTYNFTIDPICTPTFSDCSTGEIVCPSGDCPGGCGLECRLYTPTTTPEPMEPLFYVKITGENINPNQGLFLRECGATLYDSCRTLYALVSCDYHPELSTCTNGSIPVYEVKYKSLTNSKPADVGYWLNVVCHWSNPGCADYWIPACLADGRNFTDWDCQ